MKPLSAIGWLVANVADHGISMFLWMVEQDMPVGPQAIEGAAVKITILTRDKDVLLVVAKVGEDTIRILANIPKKDGKLILSKLHMDGSKGGKVGVKRLFEVAREIGRQEGVEAVIVEGAKRSTGNLLGKHLLR